MATVTNGVVTDRTVLQNTDRELANSIGGYGVLAVPRAGTASWTNGEQPATLDLKTGVLRLYDLGASTTYCILGSPDGTKLLVCQGDGQTFRYLVLDLPSGRARLVGELTVGGLDKPIGWSDRAIFFPVVGGISAVDAESLASMRINVDGNVSSVSSNGNYLGVAKNVNAGAPPGCSDSLFLVRNDWTTVVSGAREASPMPLVSQANKDFRIVDVGDDGSVIYTVADCTNPHQHVAPKSFYYYSAGRSTLQSGVSDVADVTYMAAPQSAGLLLPGSVAVVARRPQGISELDLIHLCTYDGCQPETTTIARGDASVGDYAFSLLR